MGRYQTAQEQLRTRLDAIIKGAARAQDALQTPALAGLRDRATVGEQLNTIARRCSLMHGLLRSEMPVREFNELVQREGEFIASAERIIATLRRRASGDEWQSFY